ncbi:hypothetical protein [Nocardiopsis chromatogenes]|uniref:hypothetical protein n=1 Tax=Nocardiopsis chromatogenes TaxID=280239 RepID=UPI00034DC2A2
MIAASLMTGLFPAPAHADHEDTPTSRQLLEACDNGTDACVFHPDGRPEYFAGPADQVGRAVYNCTGREQRFEVSWSDTTTETNSVGVSMGVEYGYAEVFRATFKATYGHEWSSSHTESQTTYVFTGPYEVGWVERAPRMEQVSGTYELRFPDRYYGHYIWYVPFEATGPAPGGEGAIAQQTRPMTQTERNECP